MIYRLRELAVSYTEKPDTKYSPTTEFLMAKGSVMEQQTMIKLKKMRFWLSEKFISLATGSNLISSIAIFGTPFLFLIICRKPECQPFTSTNKKPHALRHRVCIWWS